MVIIKIHEEFEDKERGSKRRQFENKLVYRVDKEIIDTYSQ